MIGISYNGVGMGVSLMSSIIFSRLAGVVDRERSQSLIAVDICKTLPFSPGKRKEIVHGLQFILLNQMYTLYF
jgi:hypothetical protein